MLLCLIETVLSLLNAIQDKFAPIVQSHSFINFAILSDVLLDNPKTFANLRRMFEGYEDSGKAIPMAFIFCGNFSSTSCITGGASGIAKYQGSSFFPPPMYLPSPDSLRCTAG
jgi:hypothetical protein